MTIENRPSRGPQLPLWPERVRGGPNAILRSALFAGIASKKRQILGTQTRPEKKPEGVTIAAQDGIKIKYSGVQFNQYDADVFFEALHRARRDLLDTECRFTGAEFLKSIGRSRNNLNYEDLDESLDRLRRGSLDLEFEVSGRRYIFSGSLVASYVRETTTKLYKVTFAKEIQTLFMPATWTQIEWDERMALMGKPLAQWLHSYFSTHAQPFPVSAAYLQEKSGSPTKLLKHFKVELKRAFAAMETAIGWEFSWDGDLVILKRPPSEAQGRHLARKAAKRQAQLAASNGQRGGGMVAVSDLLPGLLKDLKRKNRRQ
ncbi:TrfA-related protein (plasmid) [Acidisarcina polymorpha]|uniref:TrfA-related protein n=1 Tax=Acidisarcina polymorpha TaxID=2211140 RepID=A0A2Z5GAD9_9BACT|nr:plasmid replication initiator TrfA [Acidisarcina polymorpha]AXC15968.1 TrfA-related protein [Acidisarcina polymorpha]